MNRKTAAAVIVTASLAVLLSGCAGAAAQTQVNDNLKPLANSAAIGLARGHVIVKDDLSPTRPQAAHSVSVEQPFSAEVWRELKGVEPATVEHPFSDAVKRELKGSEPATVEHPFSDAVKRELKGSAPAAVNDDLSPLRDGTRHPAPTPTPTPDTVDDDLSPLGGSR